MPLTSDQAAIIQQTAPILKHHGYTLTTRFYENMLNEVPSLNNVFNRTNQLNGAQARALAGSLLAYASHINDLGALSPAVEQICQKHASVYVQPEQYDVVGRYLLGAMKEVLGDALTPKIQAAWEAAYKQLADIMIKREAQIYERSDGWTIWHDFVISKKIKESDVITSFYLEPRDPGKMARLPSYLPGQYISVKMNVPELGILQARQYSLSDAPNPNYYRISVKKEKGVDPFDPGAAANPGYISNILHETKQVGDVLQVSHPAGEFFLDVRNPEEKKVPVILISAGVGLTPLLSIINTLVAEDSEQPVTWIHATRSSSVHAFRRDIRTLAEYRRNVRAHVFIKNPKDDEVVPGDDYQYKGRMNLDKLDRQDLLLDRNDAKYFICGPERFMADMEKKLRDLGVDMERIKLELFGTGSTPQA
ncbi:MAG: hypothetical protein Q9217_005134 [Psora testacea]